MNDLKEKAIRGASARIGSQAATFLLRVGSLMVLARLLEPKDFGLVGMVTAFTGVLVLFRDFGLSAAAVQRATVTQAQISTLFWINVLLGAILTVVTFALAPLIAVFYHEPRLFWVTIVVATGFLFNAAGIQHAAVLQRQMRFTALSVIDVSSYTVGTAIAIGAAKAGFGYWALAAMTVTLPLASTIGFWLTTGWVPGMPQRRSGIRPMIRYGGTMTMSGLAVYVASNFEKILLGRFWGAEAIGIYGRAYQLSRLPSDTLNGAVGEVAFAALSRIQDDASRLRSYFLKGYSLVLALTLPATVACALFADDVISVLLGQKWRDAAPVFRLLAPTIAVFAICNPLAWLLSAIGQIGRALRMSLFIAPFMIVGYIIGLPYGPRGVAIAYSIVMMLWVIPAIVWSAHGTPVCVSDILFAVSHSLVSSLVAGGLAFGARSMSGQSPLPRLVLESIVFVSAYVGILLYVMGRKSQYVDLFHGLLRRPLPAGKADVSGEPVDSTVCR